MSKAACTYSSRSVDEGSGERGVFVCMLVCVLCECMGACSGEVDCESSLVTHKASAIKAAHFNTLSYGKNTQMDAHSWLCTHMPNITVFGFLFKLSLLCVSPPASPPPFVLSWINALFRKNEKKAHMYTHIHIRSGRAPCWLHHMWGWEW